VAAVFPTAWRADRIKSKSGAFYHKSGWYTILFLTVEMVYLYCFPLAERSGMQSNTARDHESSHSLN